MTDLPGLFRYLTHGVYVIGVYDGVRRNAFTAAWVMQASFSPLLLALSINPKHASYALLTTGRVFSVNVLQEQQLHLAAHFGSPGQSDRLAAVDWQEGMTGAPILLDALAYFDCELKADHPAGDHRVVLGQVVDGAVLQAGVPMNYRETGTLDGSEVLYPEHF